MIIKIIRSGIKGHENVKDYIERAESDPKHIASNMGSEIFNPDRYRNHPEIAIAAFKEQINTEIRGSKIDNKTSELYTALNYITSKPGARLFHCNSSQGDQLIQRASLRPDIKGPFQHWCISLDPNDRDLSDEEWHSVIESTIEQMVIASWKDRVKDAGKRGHKIPEKPNPKGFLYTAEKHSDREHSHVHILLCKIGENGEVYSGNNWLNHASDIAREFERELGLRQLNGIDFSRNESSLEQHKQKPNRRRDHHSDRGLREEKDPYRISAKTSYLEAANWDDFKDRMKSIGLTLLPGRKGRGYSFQREEGDIISASELGFRGSMSIGRIRTILNKEEESLDPLARVRRVIWEARRAAESVADWDNRLSTAGITRVEKANRKEWGFKSSDDYYNRKDVGFHRGNSEVGKLKFAGHIKQREERPLRASGPALGTPKPSLNHRIQEMRTRKRLPTAEQMAEAKKVIKHYVEEVIGAAKIPMRRYIEEELNKLGIKVRTMKNGKCDFGWNNCWVSEGDIDCEFTAITAKATRAYHRDQVAHFLHAAATSLSLSNARTGRIGFRVAELQGYLGSPKDKKSVIALECKDGKLTVKHIRTGLEYSMSDLGIETEGQHQPLSEISYLAAPPMPKQEWGLDWKDDKPIEKRGRIDAVINQQQIQKTTIERLRSRER